jgi:polar amino acid transport system substrate-binding protein
MIRTLPGAFPVILALSFLLSLHPGISSAADQSALEKINQRGVLLWGSDSEGGAPYVFPDPKNPSKLIGFELDIAEAVARELGVKAQLVQTAWDSLIPALERGDYDIAMNGLEIVPERLERVLMSHPYYVYTLQLVVRKDDIRIRSIQTFGA